MSAPLFGRLGALLAFLVTALLLLVVVPLVPTTPTASAAIPTLGWTVLGNLIVGAALWLAPSSGHWPRAAGLAAGLLILLWGILLAIAGAAFGPSSTDMLVAAIGADLAAAGEIAVAVCSVLAATGLAMAR